jgi:phage gp29-like protein
MDLLIMAQQADAEFLAQQATAQLVVPLVDANYGENEPAPQISVGTVGADVETTAQDAYWLFTSGAIKADRPAREWLREVRGMPAEDPDDPVYALPTPDAPAPDPNAPPIPSGGQ